ncbi:hypothetical protein N9C64_00465 [Paracoccaceae bacterium]|nr:hypothetical protein [Paracoccaceae bacterium]
MLSIVCLTRGESHLLKWIEYHLSFFESILPYEWELIVCCEKSLENLNINHKNLYFHPGMGGYHRTLNGFRKAQYDNILRIADDDYITQFNPGSLIHLKNDYVGVVANVSFSSLNTWSERRRDENLRKATSNDIIMDAENGDERLKSFFSTPFPGDNSVYYGVYKKSVLIKCLEGFECFHDDHYVAADWVYMAQILSQGKVARCHEWNIIRHMTHFSKTLSEKTRKIEYNHKQINILEVMPFLPALTFVRDCVCVDSKKIWRPLIEWNLIRYAQLSDNGHVKPNLQLDSLTIINIFQESRWKDKDTHPHLEVYVP